MNILLSIAANFLDWTGRTRSHIGSAIVCIMNAYSSFSWARYLAAFTFTSNGLLMPCRMRWQFNRVVKYSTVALYRKRRNLSILGEDQYVIQFSTSNWVHATSFVKQKWKEFLYKPIFIVKYILLSAARVGWI